jgi:cation/acetate symporter
MPSWLAVLLTLGAVAALLALAGGLLEAVANALSHDLYYRTLDGSAPAGRRLIVARASVVLVAGIATAAILNASPGALSLAPWTFSLAASGLFPALALGLWWGRANRQGAVAGMIAGAALCLYYMLAPRYIPIIFYETSSLFSNATHEQAANYLLLKQTYLLAKGAGKDEALAAWEQAARQLPNWGGVSGAFAAIFAVPVGFLVIIGVSFLTPAPSADIRRFVAELRAPGLRKNAAPQLGAGFDAA